MILGGQHNYHKGLLYESMLTNPPVRYDLCVGILLRDCENQWIVCSSNLNLGLGGPRLAHYREH